MDAAIIGAAQRVEHYEIAGLRNGEGFRGIAGRERSTFPTRATPENRNQTVKTDSAAEQINSQAGQGEQEKQGIGPSKPRSKRAA